MTYTLYALACDPRVQAKLRAELAVVNTDTPSLDELNALPYLDAVVKETLRLHAPVSQVSRRVARDDVLQLSKPFIDINGRVHEHIRYVLFEYCDQILGAHVVAIPGQSAQERLRKHPNRCHQQVARNLGTRRGQAGARALGVHPGCRAEYSVRVGPAAHVHWRAAQLYWLPLRHRRVRPSFPCSECRAHATTTHRMKALLFALVRAFEFELAVPESEMRRTYATIVNRPVVDDPVNPYQLPLLIKPVVP